MKVTVDAHVTIEHERDRLRYRLVIDRANVDWLVAYLGVAFDWVVADEPTRTRGGDDLRGFPGGHDSHPVANIHNQRCGSPEGFHHLTVDEPEARELIALLSAAP